MQLRLLLFLLLSLSSFSQKTWYHYSDVVEKKSNPLKYWEDVYRFDKAYYKNNSYLGKNYEDFCRDAALYLYEDMCKGMIYSDLEGFESYAHKVLETLVRDTAITNGIKVVFYRDGSLNASMSESGLLRLNVGMLARLNNEAELAILLGHEVAHFIHLDAAKAFRKELDGGVGTWKWTWAGMIYIPDNNLWYSREQEEAADFTSVNYIKQSSYSIKSAGNLYRMFKRDEIRSELQYGKTRQINRTHPDPGDRIKMVKGFAENNEKSGRKKYVVDSVQFHQLKEICFMESVNIGFSQNDLDEVITMLFSRYLMEPKNEMNLSALIEAIRRIIVLNEKGKIGKKPFILYQYRTERKEALVNYPFLGEKDQSILKYLSKGFVDIWKEDLESIKALDLLDPSKIEFTTYQEAYDYFIQKAKENNFHLAEHYKFFGEYANFIEADSYNKVNTIFETKEYLAQSLKEAPDKTACIVLPFSSYALLKTLGPEETPVLKEKFNLEMVERIKRDFNGQVYGLEDFSFNNQNLVRSLVYACRNELNIVSPNGLISRSQIRWTDLSPEAYALFERTKTTRLYICLPFVTSTGSHAQSKVAVFFYKISLPGLGKYNMEGIEKDWKEDVLKDREVFFENLDKQFASFRKNTGG